MKKTWFVAAVAALASACGGSDPQEAAAGAAATETEELPLRRGDVWEVDPKAPGEAQMLAYLNGLHAFVRQGDEIYTATTRLTEVKSEGGVLTAKLGGGLEAKLEQHDEKSMLTFSSGQSATLREHQAPGE